MLFYLKGGKNSQKYDEKSHLVKCLKCREKKYRKFVVRGPKPTHTDISYRNNLMNHTTPFYKVN